MLREIALEKQNGPSPSPASTSLNWLPWAIAALVLVCCGGLVFDRVRLERELADLREADPLAHATLFSLASPTGDLPETKAVVAWQPDRQSGVITISHLPLPAKGRDYQLWAVDEITKNRSRRSHSRQPNGARIHFRRIKTRPGQSVCDRPIWGAGNARARILLTWPRSFTRRLNLRRE